MLSAILLFEMEGEENKFYLLYLALKITEKRQLLSRVAVPHTHSSPCPSLGRPLLNFALRVLLSNGRPESIKILCVVTFPPQQAGT